MIRLSDTQRKAVEFGEGALLVVAGPGSGKTRVLTERIRRLLIHDSTHYHILALTFTNKAANEMKDRLRDIEGLTRQTFIGTFHSFCADVLAQKGDSVGVNGLPQIFETYGDRKALLLQAVNEEPELLHALKLAGDKSNQSKRLDDWLHRISTHKNNLCDVTDVEVDFDRRLYEVYNAALRASGGVDFDDLLLLTHRLFIDRPMIAAFYRRLYKYVCIDEAQDLNNAQYGVLTALCAGELKNVVMVGDPKQSIFGFNYSDPSFMEIFKRDFGASVLELTENYRSSQAVVDAARSLNHDYQVEGKLPIRGEVELIVGENEDEEASAVIARVESLMASGHVDIEGEITYRRIAILGRTRYTLLGIEKQIRTRAWPYFKQTKAGHECESDAVGDFETCLKLLVNPKDRLHRDIIAKSWRIEESSISIALDGDDGLTLIERLVSHAAEKERAELVLSAINVLCSGGAVLPLSRAFDELQNGTNRYPEEDRRLVGEDLAVLRDEWDRYCRSGLGGAGDLGSFLTHMALGTTQQFRNDGLALLTIHSAKGLEFDVVFIVGMLDGIFPDYRSKGKPAAEAEERRNAFVAVSRSKRLLFCSCSKLRVMPWGDIKTQIPSIFLYDMGLLTRS